MMKFRFTQIALVVAVAVVGLTPSVSADSVNIGIFMGTQGGFGHSWIHAATSCSSSGFCMNGAKLFSLSGNIDAELTIDGGGGHTLTITDQDIVATPTGAGGHTGTWVLRITGANVIMSDAAGDLTAIWTLDYTLDRTDGASSFEHSGSFHLFPLDFGVGDPGGPNYLDEDSIALWANNWNKDVAGGAPAGTPDLGIDIRGAIVPEPGSLLLVGSGLLSGAGLLKRKLGR